MNQPIKILNGAIKLPKFLQKSWAGGNVLLFPSKDTLVVKRIQKPSVKLSETAGRVVALPKFTSRQVQKEIEVYRRGR